MIRDHIGATPLANLQNTLTADLSRLWDGLSKPTGLESCLITDFFDLSFATLPHKLLQPDLFESEVKSMRKRFVDPKSEGYVFLSKYHKRIPADGISQYMCTIWVRLPFSSSSSSVLALTFWCNEGCGGDEQGSRPSNTAGTLSTIPMRRNCHSRFWSILRRYEGVWSASWSRQGDQRLRSIDVEC